MSVPSVPLKSSSMVPSALTLHPDEDFLLSEPPVLSEPVAWQSFQRPLSSSSIHPRGRDVQEFRHFLDGEKLTLRAALLDLLGSGELQHSTCGDNWWRFLVLRRTR